MPRLVTIPFSHYCEKARWALDRAGVEYDEDGRPPALHLRATLPYRSRTVPLLVTEGAVLTESRDILRWADARMAPSRQIYPTDPAHRHEVEDLEALFDAKLGHATRRWAFGFILADARRAEELLTTGLTPDARRRFSPMVPVVRRVMQRGFRVTKEGVERSRERIAAIFAEVSSRLARGGGFLVGDAFSAADLTFATLAAPALAPPEWAFLPPKDSLPAPMRDEIDTWRDTPAGRHGLAMFSEHR